ncbi:MAG TPA: hypothetical protein VLT33_12055, partial [Labilithrix sp.]|nr:hypothetical protein [Labilithrix sp.]
ILVATMLTKPPIPLSSLRPDAPAALDAVIARCLEKEAGNRYATASAVASALAPFTTARARAALDTLRRTGRPAGAAAPAEKRGAKDAPASAASERRSRRVATVVALVGLAVTILLLGVIVGMLIAKPRTAPPQQLIQMDGH